jgi:hypothetical protein
MKGRTVRNVILLGAAAVSAALTAPRLARSGFTEGAVDLAEGPSEIVARAAARVVSPSTESHPGFDTNVYPGDNAMDAWRRSGEYEWVGYYLPAPCHRDASWSGKRARLTETAWGLAVIYVGQQTWGRSLTPVTRKPTTTAKKSRTKRGKTVRSMARTSRAPVAKPGDSCSTTFVGATRGQVDAADAIARTAKEGFDKGTVIFLDIERMETIPTAMREYYRAWTAVVLADGRYRPGIYAHTHNAESIYNDVRQEFQTAGVQSEPSFWIAGSSDFDVDKRPTEVGHAFADVWQGLLDVVRTHGGVRLPIDISVSAVPSPSAVVE